MWYFICLYNLLFLSFVRIWLILLNRLVFFEMDKIEKLLVNFGELLLIFIIRIFKLVFDDNFGFFLFVVMILRL